MARRVFFSFHYDNDINRSMIVRNSWQRGNAVIGVYINWIRDMRTLKISAKGNIHTVIGYYEDGSPAYFDNVCDGIYDYLTLDGYANMGSWLEIAACAHNKW